MPLINILIVLVIVGFLLWLVNNYIPMDGKIKKNSQHYCFNCCGYLGPEGFWAFKQTYQHTSLNISKINK